MNLSRRAVLLSAAASLPLWAAKTPLLAQDGGKSQMTLILHPEPPTLMMGLNQQTIVQIVAGKIYQSLLTFGFDFTPKPGLAKEWSVSDDGMVYRFTLFDNISWHDGRPFTTEDVLFSTMTFLPAVHPRARANFGHVKEALAIDEKTIEFRLKQPYPPFLMAFESSSAPMVPKHLYDGTDFRTNPANHTPVGTGPFRFKEWKRGQYIHLTKNENYYKDGLPYLDDLYFRIIPDSSSRLAALENQEADLASFGDIDYVYMKQIAANPNLEITEKGYEFAGPLGWIEFNHRTAPMNDKRFRQAVLHALDRDFIARNIWFGQAAPATGPFNSKTKFYDPDTRQYPFDRAEAARLLDEMGLKPDADGKRVRLKLLGLPHGDSWTRLSEYIRQSLGKVGIDVLLESTDIANWAKRYANWEFDMALVYLYQYGDPALGVSRNYLTDSIIKGAYGTNASGYSNPEVDALFNEAAVENDEKRRAQLYADVQKLLCEEAPLGWLVELRFPTITSRKFKDVITTAIGVAESFEQARIE